MCVCVSTQKEEYMMCFVCMCDSLDVSVRAPPVSSPVSSVRNTYDLDEIPERDIICVFRPPWCLSSECIVRLCPPAVSCCCCSCCWCQGSVASHLPGSRSRVGSRKKEGRKSFSSRQRVCVFSVCIILYLYCSTTVATPSVYV